MLCSNKKCSLTSKILFFAAIPVVLWLIWSRGTEFASKKIVESGLQKLSAQLSDMLSANGGDVQLKYGKIDISGSDNNMVAIVHDLALQIHPEKGKGAVATISTEEAVFSRDVTEGKLSMTISKPTHVIAFGFVYKALVWDEPLKINYMQTMIDGVNTMKSETIIPKKITLVDSLPLPESVTGDKKLEISPSPSDTFIEFEENPTLYFTYEPERKGKSLSYNLANLTISTNGKKTATIGSANELYNEKVDNEGNMVISEHNLTISDIILYKDGDSTTAYLFKLVTEVARDLGNEESDEEKSPATENLSIDPRVNADEKPKNRVKRSVTIKEISLSNPDFKLNISGAFHNTKIEHLPNGRVDVEISNPNQFLNSEFVEIIGKDSVKESINRAIGSVEGKEHVFIPLRREKKGVFYVGSTTFEEIAMPLLTRGMMPKSHSELERAAEVSSTVGRPQNDKAFDGSSGKTDSVAKPAPTSPKQ